MPVELMNPDGLPKPEPYRQIAVATGARLVLSPDRSPAPPTATRSAAVTSPHRSSGPT